MRTTMRISQLAERSGVPATTLRFYEGAGLLTAGRTPAGYRSYDEGAVERLAFIGAAKHLGLPLDEIAELLTVRENGACHEVRADLRPRIAARLDEAEHRVEELTAFAASLHAALDHLDALPARADRCDPECGPLSAQPPAVAAPVDVRLSNNRKAAAEQEERWRAAPVACSLSGDGTGTTDSTSERAEQWHRVLDGGDRTPIADGIRLTLPADRAGEVAGLAASEQQCCPFFDFHLHLAGPRLLLEVRAPAEGTEQLADLFGTAA
ncbi:MerR family transcriptional regulator [Streptomyces sp. NPDC048565]|uniref:MerR family transcriptional regulator n=1 Tax=Streptomyces sp. NPDC048565 TaxID=3155266 RepID=UPI00343F1306